MEWNTKVGNFCESKLYGHPEILNCMSCIFISLFPYIGLRYSQLYYTLTKHIFILLILTGFTSFGYHWSGYYLFKHLDEIPMILSIWFGIINTHKLIGNYIYTHFITHSYFILMLSINTIPTYNYIFPILFGIACISLLIPLKLNRFFNKQTKELSNKGIYISIISAFIWIITEEYCNVLFILGHSVWHFGISFGMYNIILSVEFCLLNQYDNYHIDYMYYFIPIIQKNSYSV